MIKWFKGYLILSTYAKDISNQSCITNRETPCRSLGPTNTRQSIVCIQEKIMI